MRRVVSPLAVSLALASAIVLVQSTAHADAPTEVSDEPDFCEHAAIDEAKLYAMVAAVNAQPLPAQRSWPRWDRRATPARLTEVQRQMPFRREDHDVLRKNGFVVLDRWIANPAHAYGYLYTAELPVFVTLESLFWAVAVGHENLLAALERERVVPETTAILDALDIVSAQAGDDLVERDVDLYVAVARALLTGRAAAPRFADNRATAKGLIERIIDPDAGLETVSVFGRTRQIDFSLYRPRGAYAGDRQREQWFRALTWLTRFELNVVSRDCQSSHPGLSPDPSETPREAALALALSQRVQEAGMGLRLGRLSATLDLMVASRVDVSAADLVQAQPSGAYDAKRVATAIGKRFVRTTPTHPMPAVEDLPVVWTLLGLRTTESTDTLATLLTPTIRHRTALTGADVAVALGHTRGRVHLADELRRYPVLAASLAKAPAMLEDLSQPGTLRGSWLDAIVALSLPAGGVTPSFMHTAAYGDFQMNTALAAYARLRRNFVSYEAASFSWSGCDVPDGYVEPAPAALEKLIAYAQLGQLHALGLDPDGRVGVRGYYQRVEQVFTALAHIVRRELVGAELSREERDFLHQIVEKTENIYDNSVAFDGWYMDLFFAQQPFRKRAPLHESGPHAGEPILDARPDSPIDPEDPAVVFDKRSETAWGISSNVPEALSSPDIVVDIATAIDQEAGAHISHLGTSPTRWAVFVVDTGGGPRALVGPVSLAFAAPRPFPERLDDEGARRLTKSDRVAPWTTSFAPWYARKSAPWPDVRFTVDCAAPLGNTEASTDCTDVVIAMTSKGRVGRVTFELVDWYGRTVRSRSEQIGVGARTLRFVSGPRVRNVASKSSAKAVVEEDDEVPSLADSLSDVIVRRGLDEWRISVRGEYDGGFPQSLSFEAPRAAGAMDESVEGEGDE